MKQAKRFKKEVQSVLKVAREEDHEVDFTLETDIYQEDMEEFDGYLSEDEIDVNLDKIKINLLKSLKKDKDFIKVVEKGLDKEGNLIGYLVITNEAVEWITTTHEWQYGGKDDYSVDTDSKLLWKVVKKGDIFKGVDSKVSDYAFIQLTLHDVPENLEVVYEYHINLDERGEFSADVRRSDNEATVFEIEGFDIFEDGFMKHKDDLDGLQEHLVDLGILEKDDELVEG